MQLTGDALFIVKFSDLNSNILNSNLSKFKSYKVMFSLILHVLGYDSNFLTALSIGSIMSFVGSSNASLAEIPKLSVTLAKKWLKISAISESRLTTFPSSIKVIAGFTCTLSENSGYTVFQNL